MSRYNPQKIEKKWQRVWEKQRLYRAVDGSKKKKYYALFEFPYPSGEGLHVGHLRPYVGMDLIARKRRMEGYNVLFPIGWDAFGLPTENYAIKHKIHPRIVTKQNSANFKRQMKLLGLSLDWDREINTTDPAYYKWTQWIFLKLFEAGLAYKAKTTINWCPKDKIGLANEEVVGGACERCGTQVEKREKEQWMLKITAYAEKLLEGLKHVDYIPQARVQQENWIGKSEGALIKFEVRDVKSEMVRQAHHENFVEIFTTRADTLFGATYLVLAPEHELIRKLESRIKNLGEVKKYIAEAKRKTDIERTAEHKEKTGMELKGIKAINPANQEEIPIWISDYVLAGYGTGAIMAVPAHDERDFEFAKKFKLPIKTVIEPTFIQSTEPGKVVGGVPFDHREAIIAIVKHWSQDKYIALRWKKVAWGTFITGGIEEGQTPEEAAKMEIRQETGYLHPKLMKDLGVVHGKFYHVPKKTNRNAHAHTLYLELQDDARMPIAEEEQTIHEILWLSKEELKKFLTPDSHQYGLKLLFDEASLYIDEGTLANSGDFNRLESVEARKAITRFVGGKITTQYKLRDWVFSRQRYWGEPIPLIFCEHCAKTKKSRNKGESLNSGWVPVIEKNLPVALPNVKNYMPTDTGESPLANIKSWVKAKCPRCGGPARRETDVMPNWAGSSWYFLRYTDPKNKKEFASKKKMEYWMGQPAPSERSVGGVDWYNGGMEHTVLHLLYSRFWNQFLFDQKLVPTREPYKKRTSHGLIMGEGGIKMSKSKGNVINPDTVVEKFGADALRLYEMFLGPFNQPVAWDPRGIIGMSRFLERVWLMSHEKKFASKVNDTALETLLHKTIKKVSEDIESMSFNTAVSTLMIFTNECRKCEVITRDAWEAFLIMLAPFAPHIAEELWRHLGKKKSIHIEPWPTYDKRKIIEETFMLIIQINGRVRDSFEAPRDISKEEAEKLALSRERVKDSLENKSVRKIVFVPGRLISFVF